MGIVTNHLVSQIAKQVDEHQLVVWYDPQEVYSSVAAELTLPDTTVARYDGSFFKLRREIDSLMNDDCPPRLVVYVPEDRSKTHLALCELEAAGVVIQPNQQPPNRNTRLAIVARNALRPVLGDEIALEVEKQAELGKLTLPDLDNLASKGKEISTGVLALIFGNANPQDVALAFLGTDKFDIATPWTFACFRSKGGARAYFHGGLSPQELIVPVAVLKPLTQVGASAAGIEWKLTPGSAKLTTRFFSVLIAAEQGQSALFGLEPPKVRVEVRANKKCISKPASASYGFEDATGEVRLRVSVQDPKQIEPNTVTVMIVEEPGQKTVAVYLVDAATGADLSSIEKIETAIAM